jgi:hypothetical protein
VHISRLLTVGTALALSWTSIAQAADPDGVTCTVIKQALLHTEYDVIVTGVENAAVIDYLERSYSMTKAEFPDVIGNVDFHVRVAQMPQSLTANENSYVICAAGCQGVPSDIAKIEVDLDDLVMDEAVMSLAAGHMARASISMIQTFESQGADLASETVFSLSRTHLISE